MDDALQLCGFNADTSRFLIDQGFTTPNDLLLATESELDAIARDVSRTPPRGNGNIAMPFIAMKHLKGFRFWADECERTVMISVWYHTTIPYWYMRQSTQIMSDIIIGTNGTQTGTQVFR